MNRDKREVRAMLIYLSRETRNLLDTASNMTSAFSQEERQKFCSFHRVVSGIEDGLVRLHQRSLYRR